MAFLGETEWIGLLSLAALLFAIALVAWFAYTRLGNVAPKNELMPYLEHLEELRGRLLRVAIFLVLWSTLFLTFRAQRFTLLGVRLAYPAPDVFDNAAAQVYRTLLHATVPPNVQLIVSTPTEAVAAQMTIALFLALVLTLPFLLYEFWAFFAPGLRARERLFLRRVFPAFFFLFVLGAFFGFRFVVPVLFAVLYGFAEPLGALPLLSAGSLVSTVATMSLLFGVAFQLPLVMGALVRFGLATPQTFTKKWRHATLAIIIVAGVATDPTLTSQLIVASILLVLYASGILAAHWMHRNHASARPAPSPKAT